MGAAGSLHLGALKTRRYGGFFAKKSVYLRVLRADLSDIDSSFCEEVGIKAGARKLSGVGSSFGKHERRQSGNGDPKLERRTKRTYSEPIYKGDKIWDAQLASIWVLPIPASHYR